MGNISQPDWCGGNEGNDGEFTKVSKITKKSNVIEIKPKSPTKEPEVQYGQPTSFPSLSYAARDRLAQLKEFETDLPQEEMNSGGGEKMDTAYKLSNGWIYQG